MFVHDQQTEATKQYCQIVDDLVGSTDSSETDDTVADNKDYKEIIISDDDGARTILLNRPAKYNALNYQVHKYMTLYWIGILLWPSCVYRCHVVI